MSGSQAIRQDDRYLNEHGQMVMPVPPYNEMDEIDLYQCDNCKEWFKAGDTFVTGGSGEFCYNEPCRKLQDEDERYDQNKDEPGALLPSQQTGNRYEY